MKPILIVLYYVVFGFVFSGFVLHDSHTPAILQYSGSYFLFLCLLSCGFLLPPLVWLALRKFGPKNLLLAVVPSTVLIALVYGALSLRYYYTQTHLFDPYLQVPPPSFGPGQLEKPADRYRIIALGGSTTRNPLLAVEHRYPTVLQSLLRAQYGREDLEVFNGGMDWYTSKHSLINYVTNLRDGDPDLVVVMHAVNDMYRSFSPTGFAVGPYHRLWSHFYGPSIYGAKPPSFEQHISSKVVWPSVASVMFSRVRLVERDLPLERFVSRADFERNMRSLLTVLEADGVPVILMTQPFLFKDEMTPEERATLWFGRTFCLSSTESLRSEYPSPRSLAAAMRAYNETVRVLAGEGENVMLLEAESNLAKNLDNFTDDVHYTPAGARRLATAVQEKIGQAGLIDAWLR